MDILWTRPDASGPSFCFRFSHYVIPLPLENGWMRVAIHWLFTTFNERVDNAKYYEKEEENCRTNQQEKKQCFEGRAIVKKNSCIL